MRYILLILFALVTTFASAQVQFLGSPTTTVRNRGNFVSDSLFYLPKRTKAPSDSGALRYQISDSALYVWTGSQWIKAGGGSGSVLISDTSSMLSPYIRAAGNGLTKSGQSLLVDTAAIATRARVQKAVDSLGAVKGSGTVTSVSAGTGMSFTTITSTGSVAADTLTLSTRAWRQKGIDSVAGLSRIGGSGTTNYVPKFTAGSTIGNSQILDNGTNVMVNTSSTAGIFVVGGIQQNASQTIARFFANNTSAESKALDININAGDPSVILSAASAGTDASLGFMTDGVERQRIFNNGRVGFNTLSDAGYLVDINGTLRTVNGVVLASGSGNIGLGITSSPWSFSGNIDMGNDNNLFAGNVAFGFGMNAYYDGGWKYKGTGNASYIKQENGTFQFYTSSSGTAGNTITFTRPMTLTQSAELIINSITDAGAYNLQVSGNIYNTGSITTGAPSGGSIKPWKIGEAATVSPTSPNRTIRVEIDGTVYYLHAKTTND